MSLKKGCIGIVEVILSEHLGQYSGCTVMIRSIYPIFLFFLRISFPRARDRVVSEFESRASSLSSCGLAQLSFLCHANKSILAEVEAFLKAFSITLIYTYIDLYRDLL
jgi:hypothetical protein